MAAARAVATFREDVFGLENVLRLCCPFRDVTRHIIRLIGNVNQILKVAAGNSDLFRMTLGDRLRSQGVRRPRSLASIPPTSIGRIAAIVPVRSPMSSEAV